MGHYLSEMEGPDEAAARHWRARVIEALHGKGYYHPGVKTPRFGSMGETVALHHLPCGLAIYDPEVHEPLCPANDSSPAE